MINYLINIFLKFTNLKVNFRYIFHLFCIKKLLIIFIEFFKIEYNKTDKI
jgi:hypothetical protein